MTEAIPLSEFRRQQAKAEFAAVILRLCQGHAEALVEHGLDRNGARDVVMGALWRATMEAMADTAANQNDPFKPLFGDEGD